MKNLFFMLAAVALACNACAAGIILSEDSSIPDPVLLNHYVNVSIENDIATVELSQEFRNVGNRDLQGSYIFPIPDEGISEYHLTVDGTTYDAQLKNSSEALDEYRMMISERNDASLLRVVGGDTLSSELWLPKGQTVKISLSYKQTIPKKAGIYYFDYPLHPGRYTITPIDPVNISAKIKTGEEISVLYSPTHPISKEKSGNEAYVEYYEEKVIPNKDFQLLYSTVESENDIKMLAHMEEGEDGYFLLFIYPTIKTNETIPKDIVFVIDVSGSMAGDKIEQAKNALKHNLQNLGEGDRFNIVAFSDEIQKFSPDLADASEAGRAAVYVDSLRAEGSTDLYNSQIEAVEMLDEEDGRTKIVVFLTDGMDTTGHSTDFILDELEKKRKNWRIYPFGIGRDLDFELISSEANEFGDGIPVYVESDADLEYALTDFYQRISVPALTDAELDFYGFAYDTYPARLDNLYAENTVLVAGRYNRTGITAIKLTGEIGNRSRTWFYVVEFPEEEDNPFVEKMWATRKIGHLMDQINLEGETENLKNEVAYLGNKYALATPYTSLLVAAEEEYEKAQMNGSVGEVTNLGGYDIRFSDLSYHGESSYAILDILDKSGNVIEKLKIEVGETYLWTSPNGRVYDITVNQVAPGYTFGARWTELSLTDYSDAKSSTTVLTQGEALSGAEYTGAGMYKSGSPGSLRNFEMIGAKNIEDKTFVIMGDVWLDTECTGDEELEEIEFGSEDYFELLNDEEIAEYLAVDENMIVCIKNRSVRIFSGNVSSEIDIGEVFTEPSEEENNAEANKMENTTPAKTTDIRSAIDRYPNERDVLLAVFEFLRSIFNINQTKVI